MGSRLQGQSAQQSTPWAKPNAILTQVSNHGSRPRHKGVAAPLRDWQTEQKDTDTGRAWRRMPVIPALRQEQHHELQATLNSRPVLTEQRHPITKTTTIQHSSPFPRASSSHGPGGNTGSQLAFPRTMRAGKRGAEPSPRHQLIHRDTAELTATRHRNNGTLVLLG